MAHPNDELIVRFYDAFARGDGDAMAACYAPGARFSDPVFTDLRGEEPGAMWRMLTGRAKDLEVRLAEHEADAERGSAHWLADYTFSTGRPRAQRHQGGVPLQGRPDSRTPGRVLHTLGRARRSARPGWRSAGRRLVHGKVQREARAGLDEFLGNPS